MLFPVSHMCGGATKELLTAQELVTDWQSKWCRYRYSTDQDIVEQDKEGWWEAGWWEEKQVCGNSWEQAYYKGFIFINFQQPTLICK